MKRFFLKREDVTNFRNFYKFVRPFVWRSILSMLLSIPVGTMEAMIAAILKPFTDMVMLSGGSGSPPDLTYYPLLIIIFTVTQSFFKYASGYLTTWAGQKIALNIKLALFDKLMRNDAATFDRMTSGDALLRYCNDADTASSGLIGNVNTFVNRFFMSIALIAVLFWNSWILAIVAVTALFLAFIPMIRIKAKIKTIMSQSVVAVSAITTRYNEVFGGNRTVASYNLYDFMNVRIRKTLDETFRLGIKIAQRVGFMSMGMHAALAVGIAATVWLQGYMISRELITPGAFVSFLATLLMLYTPMKGIGGNYTAIQFSFQAIGRILNVLNRQPGIIDKPGAIRLERVDRGIRYAGVKFSYLPGKPVIRGVDLEIPIGQSVAFVGNSGGGKT
ncbi:MAG: ABC transporter ATP-binding protein, partial [Planctomycetota bacterium]|nr:ABC transporter ATP-binding protein [Planctomycetota bacterium]